MSSSNSALLHTPTFVAANILLVAGLLYALLTDAVSRPLLVGLILGGTILLFASIAIASRS